jgi:hypothetical protein
MCCIISNLHVQAEVLTGFEKRGNSWRQRRHHIREFAKRFIVKERKNLSGLSGRYEQKGEITFLFHLVLRRAANQ